MQAFIIFLICSLINVILQTLIKLFAIRLGRTANIFANAIGYGFYTVIVKQISGYDLPMTIFVTVIANIIGVWVSYIIMDKISKDRLWKIEGAVKINNSAGVNKKLDINEISYNRTVIDDYYIYNCYCKTQAESKKVIDIIRSANGKISAYESKI